MSSNWKNASVRPLLLLLLVVGCLPVPTTLVVMTIVDPFLLEAADAFVTTTPAIIRSSSTTKTQQQLSPLHQLKLQQQGRRRISWIRPMSETTSTTTPTPNTTETTFLSPEQLELLPSIEINDDIPVQIQSESSSSTMTSQSTAVSSTSTTSIFSDVDIIINTNAKGVTNRIIDVANRTVFDNRYLGERTAVVGAETAASYATNVTLYVTSTQQEARTAAKTILQRQRQRRQENDNNNNNNECRTLVIPVGGDGTLTSVLQWMWDEAVTEHDTNNNNNVIDFPFTFAYVAMGTGNALGSVVGCSSTNITPQKDSTSSSSNGHRRKILRSIQRRVQKFVRTPRRRKLDKFQRTIQQLLDVVEQWNNDAGTMTMTNVNENKNEDRLVSLSSPQQLRGVDDDMTNNRRIPYDIVEVPLLRVETTSPVSSQSDDDENDDESSSQRSSTSRSSLAQQKKKSYYSFFAGVGFDSLMLQDYQDQQIWKKTNIGDDNGFVDSMLSGVPGYTTALFTRTLPKCLPPPFGRRAHQMNVQISTCKPYETSWIDHRRGDFLRPVIQQQNQQRQQRPPSEFPNRRNSQESDDDDDDHDDDFADDHFDINQNTILYEGKAGIVASSTVPFYGGGLRLFPFARMGGTTDMHLRVGRIHPVRGVFNIPRIFEGSYRDKRDTAFGCLDFIGPSFHVRILDENDNDVDDLSSTDKIKSRQPSSSTSSAGYPVQHSGESVGLSTSVQLDIGRFDENGPTSTTTTTTTSPTSPPPVQFLTLLQPRPVYGSETTIR